LSKSIVDYNPNAKLKTFPDGWNIEEWIKDIAIDNDVAELFWQIMSSILRPYVRWNKSVWFYSTTGNNGKGTFCELLRNLLGPKAHTSIPLSDFGKDFTLGPLIGKQAIIVDENDVGTYIDKAGALKAVITGDIISINQKYKQPINYRFQGMMIQCLNEYPKVKDKSDSFYRRQIFVPFQKCFTGKENKNIKEVYLKDPDVLEYIMYKVLSTDFYELSEPASCKNALESYKESNDPIRQFWNELETEFAWDLLPYKFLYDLYKAWYLENYPKGQIVAKPSFEDALRTIIIRESKLFTCDPDPKKRIRSGKKMDKPEPLIAQYQLKNWYSKVYQGFDTLKKCTLGPADIAENYTGVIRK
jgi:putative DNA primase/helicase